MTDSASDPVVRQLREEIAEVDRAIVAAVNARLELVARLKHHKDTHGIPFVDPERERQLVDDLARANGGPLTPEGLRELYDRLLDLTKRQMGREVGSPE
jgi:chorismate mutase